MRDVLIACSMMEAEIQRALELSGSTAEVIWMEKRLHEKPDDLRDALQQKIEEVEASSSPDHILLGYGFCGNAMSGLHASRSLLVLPRIDDCITLFIGSRKRKAELEGGVGTLFQTRDWTDSDITLLSQRDELIEDYGEEDGLAVFEMMYGNYGRICVLDTHCYPLEEVIQRTRQEAQELGFDHQVQDASIDYLVELLQGPWDDSRFVIKHPGEEITSLDLLV